MAKDAPTLLAARAVEVSRTIGSALSKKRLKPSDLDGFRVAGDAATKLYLISTYLRSLPPYWIEPDVEELCRTILRDLEAITQPTRRATSSTLPLFRWNGPEDPETCLVNFFKVETEHARSLNGTCDDLMSKLAKDDDAEKLPDSASQHLDTPDVSADSTSGILKALESIAECDSVLHDTAGTTAAGNRDTQTLWHPTRLCLHETETSQSLRILVSTTDLTLWQEFYLRTQPESPPGDDQQQALSQGGFCRTLESNTNARLFLLFKNDHGLFMHTRKAEVLKQILQAGLGETLASVIRNYHFTPRDKVILSHAIARSYWQYYNSELMRTKWTSDTIWFMPEKDGGVHDRQLPLCGYLSFPFGIRSNNTADILYEGLLTHRCPRILDIGILLLEIGLARPFRTGKCRNKVAQANLNHKIATDEMLELEKTSWDGFANSKRFFDSAVKFCLNGENFMPSPEQPRSTRQRVVLPTPPATASDLHGVLTRRKIFYKHVVRPLAWLAKEGFKAQAGDIAYVNKKSPSPEDVSSNTPSQPEPNPSFHSEIVPKMWLRDLIKIGEQIERQRRKGRVTAPVRVAILDTGLNRDFPVFKEKSGLIRSITDEADFVKPSTLAMTDAFGHGTFMARLVMESAPSAEILVARVAANPNELKSSQVNIKEAILWAGQTGKADIISMSFGFPRDDEGIREAIEKVQEERKGKIIFLASAGNSSTNDESFPARHPSVISVYATNCHGTFLQSNSASTNNGATVLGTYGDDIPDSIREEFRTIYPKVCQPGSSVATAIMAGISATMLAYASVLPSLVQFQGTAASTSHHVLQWLRTTKGMEALLYKLSQGDPDRPRLRAVKPMWFWKNKPDDTVRYCAIRDALSDVDRKSPKV
ncbi:hypothetical protein B0I37DRAFT_389966 [Chaetomium sp. MPI-CAGE-AT-0009]|nr:hypothetical protein B0I37DRAFT_389966 [Chaetomium sp. MPI-CAGE-AT-0009]